MLLRPGLDLDDGLDGGPHRRRDARRRLGWTPLRRRRRRVPLRCRRFFFIIRILIC